MIKSMMMRLARHVARMEEKLNEYWILERNPEGRRPLEEPKHTWENNFKIDFRGIGWGKM
jgi:hypothetical protein